MSWNVMPLIFVENFMLIISNFNTFLPKIILKNFIAFVFFKIQFFLQYVQAEERIDTYWNVRKMPKGSVSTSCCF